MKQFILCFLLIAVVNVVIGLPVTKNEEKKSEEAPEQQAEDVADALEYERYLKEVVNALETDPEFRKKLDNASEIDVRSGKIANELEHVNHHVRSKLDEIKRREIERLRLLAIKQYELSNDIDREHMKISDHEHLDHDNQHTFEIEDLKKLILKTSQDLAEADKKRREEFKEYELQKEFEKQEKMRSMDEDHRKKYEEELKKQHQKHNQHERIHHPGNKAQLEEVWEKQDHMDAADFDPKTFFMMHDLDGNNFWDETEVKALFVKELDKVYQSGLPEDDMRERIEEMERMREHVFREADTNHDNLISLEEFIAQTRREEFNRDPGWETVDNQPQFTHEEYLEFERRRQEEIQRLIAQGVLPPHPNMPNGYYGNQQQHGGYQQPNAQQHHPGQQQQQMHYQQQSQFHNAQQQQYHQQQGQYLQQQQIHAQPPQYQQQQAHAQQAQQAYQQQPPPQYQQQQNYHPSPQQNYPQQPVQLNSNQVYQHVPNPNIQVNHQPNSMNGQAPINQNVPVAQHNQQQPPPPNPNANVKANAQQNIQPPSQAQQQVPINQNGPGVQQNQQAPSQPQPAQTQQQQYQPPNDQAHKQQQQQHASPNQIEQNGKH